MAKKVLGKGLGALLENIEAEDSSSIKEIRLIDIEPNKAQPRKSFDEESLEKLSESIKLHGVIQPIIVKKKSSGFYQIIAGERRWRSARMAGLKTIPAVIKDYSDKEIMEIALIENLQREDLNPIEEAEAYQNLMEEYELTQEEISVRVGKSRSAIANSLRLLNLCDKVRQFLIEEKISSGHARAILAINDTKIQAEAAKNVIDEQLSVRQTEKFVKEILDSNMNETKPKEDPNVKSNYYEIEDMLSKVLGTKVKIHSGKNKHKIEIEYYSDDDLNRILKLLG